MENNTESLDSQIREAQLRKLAIEVERLEAERREQEREEQEAIEKATRPWYKKVNFYRLGGAVAVFFPIAWFYLFEVIGPSLELQNINRELAMTQLTLQIDTLSKKIDEDLRDLEEQNQEQFNKRAALVEDHQLQMSQVDSLLDLTQVQLSSIMNVNQVEGDEETVNSLKTLMETWADFYTPSREDVEKIQVAFADFVKKEAQRMGGEFEEVEGDVGNVRRFMINDLHNAIFKDDNKNTERLIVQTFVEPLKETYTIKSLVNVEYSRRNNAKEDKMGDIPKRNARMAIQKLQFQEDFKKEIEESIRKSLPELELVFE